MGESNKKMVKRLGVGCLCVLVVVIVSYYFLRLLALQYLSNPILFKTVSPINSLFEIWFLEQGLAEREISFYACHKDKIPKKLAAIDGTFNRFSEARWTKDGNVLVIILEIGKNRLKIHGIAYDFQNNIAIIPPFEFVEDMIIQRSERMEIWENIESKIKLIVESHNGFADQKIDRKVISKEAKKIWIWQML